MKILLRNPLEKRTPAALAWVGSKATAWPFGESIPALLQASSDSRSSDSPKSGDKKTVRVGRRRRAETAPEERERADAPRRQKTDDRPTSTKTPSGSSGGVRPPRPSGGQLPGRGNPLLLIGLVILLAVCVLPFMLIFGSGDNGGEPARPTVLPATAEAETNFELPTIPAEPFVPPASSPDGSTWLVMLYQDADDKILEQDIYVDFNEAERIGSTDQVHLVAQVDRYKAGYQGDGDWSETRRYYITQDGDLQRVRSQQVEDLGEVNMADGDTLVDFVTWAVETYPADKYVLIMSDHGMGWPGGWSDPAPAGPVDRTIPLASALGDEMFLMELDDALEEIRSRTGIGQFELIGMDACLMGHVEVFSALAPHARYAVASQETEPAVGWAYAGFLDALRRDPGMNGAELSRLIVDSYIRQDQRIIDDQARAELLQKGSPLGGLFGLFSSPSAEQLTQEMSQNITLTAVDLAAMPELIGRLNDLAFVLQSASQRKVAEARTYAQSFTSIFGSDVPASYIDLGHFVMLLKQEVDDRDVSTTADNLLAALRQAVLAEKHGPKKPGATGMSIYFPNSRLFSSPVTGPESYTAIASRFADISLWDDYLSFHYTGRPFEASASELVIPERNQEVKAPGAGPIQVSEITLSDDVAAPGKPVLLSVDIDGQDIGYVYLFVGFLDDTTNAIYVADSDYLESERTREVDGVYYPDWGEEGQFTIEFEWEPVVFAINDGVDSIVSLFTPQSYGLSFDEAVYTVDGIFTYADDGDSRFARLYFSDGQLRQVFGFTGEGGSGAPREVSPQPGDTFSVLEKWFDLDQQGKAKEMVRQEGGTLTFGDQPFSWQDLNAAPGQYIVGFIVEDLDGNAYPVYKELSVE